jgi:hypothetical protein
MANPKAIAPLIEPAHDMIPFSENLILKFSTLNKLNKLE